MRRYCQTAVAFLLALSAALCVAAAPADEFPEISKLYKQGKRSDALDRIERFLVAHPRDSRARFLKGVILSEQNKPQEAIKVFTALTVDFPELPEPYNNLAVLYAQQGDLEKARQSLEMAIRTHPSYAIAHENLGDIYAALAKRAYDKALQLDKGNTTAQAKLALIRELFPASPAGAAAAPEPARAAEPGAETRAPEPPRPTETKPLEAQRPPPPAAPAPPTAAPAAPAAAAAPAAPAGKPAEPTQSAATVAATEAAKPPAAPSNAVDETKAILQMVEDWTKAWSNNDVDGYLAFYAPDFRTPKSEPRARWEAERRERLAKPRKIQVSAEGPRVTLVDANTARVSFRQNYSADGRKTRGRKTLVLAKQDERWLIRQEIVGKP
jgi:ketosteroid isomerase-like protein